MASFAVAQGSPKALLQLNALATPFTSCEQQADTKIPSTGFAFSLPESEKTYEFNDKDIEHLNQYFKPSIPPQGSRPEPLTQEEIQSYFKVSSPVTTIQEPEFSQKLVTKLCKPAGSIEFGDSDILKTDSSNAVHKLCEIQENYTPHNPTVPQVQQPKGDEESEFPPYIPPMDETWPPAVTELELMSFLNIVDDRWSVTINYFIIKAGWTRDTVFPGIPKYYAPYVQEGRALYVYDAPPNWAPKTFRQFFKNRNLNVIMDPCIIDQESGETFRWAILETPEQANRAIEELSGMGIPWMDNEKNATYHRVYICKALTKSYEIGGFWSLHKFLLGCDPGQQAATDDLPQPIHQRQPTLAPIPLTPIRKANSSKKQPQPNDIVQELEMLSIGAKLNKGMGNAVDESMEVVAAQEITKAPTTSWAMMASKAGGESKTIDLHPDNKTTRILPTVSRTPVVFKNTPTGEPLAAQLRLVFLFNLPPHMTLQKISDGIKEGPLVSIRMSTNEDDGKKYAGIIFQYAEDAEAFFQVLCKERHDSNPKRFHFIADVARGEQAIPDDETIKAMSGPTWASRRLTLVKSKFFFVMRQSHLQAFCQKEVGAENIQIVWLYNGGNATVVFAKVDDAVKVKKAFEREAASAEPNSHFSGLQVSFSKDPCVQEVHLVSDFQ